MLSAGKKRRPIWQPSKFERLRRAVSANLKIWWKNLLAALLLLFFAAVVLPELLRPVVLVDPLSVPKLLEEQGLTGQVVAAEVADRIASMEEAVETLAPKDQLRLSSDSSVPDVEVPETKLSVRSVVQLLQVFLHRQPPHIHADIVCLMPGCAGAGPAASGDAPSERLEVIYRFSDGKALFVHKRFRAIDVDDAVAKLSKLVLSQVNPYVMGRYADEIDHDPAAAVQILESCARNKDCTLRGWAFNKWGNVLSDQGKMDEAIAKYQKAIELDPKGVFPYDNWGRALLLQGKLDEAIAKYQKAIELDPKFAHPYNNWGYVLQLQGKLDEAIAKYQKAIELDPKDAFCYNNWGHVLRLQGKLDEAIAKYQKAIELDPKFAPPYNNWGNVLQDQGKLDEAIAKYQKATELDPKYASPYNNWGIVLHAQGKLDEAIAKYQKATELDPKFALAYRNWARVLRMQGKSGQAIAKEQKADEFESTATGTR